MFEGINLLGVSSLILAIPFFVIMGAFSIWLTLTGIQILLDWYDGSEKNGSK